MSFCCCHQNLHKPTQSIRRVETIQFFFTSCLVIGFSIEKIVAIIVVHGRKLGPIILIRRSMEITKKKNVWKCFQKCLQSIWRSVTSMYCQTILDWFWLQFWQEFISNGQHRRSSQIREYCDLMRKHVHIFDRRFSSSSLKFYFSFFYF